MPCLRDWELQNYTHYIFIDSLSGRLLVLHRHAIGYSRSSVYPARPQKFQREALMEERNFSKIHKQRASLGSGHIPKRGKWENQLGHPAPLPPAASELSIHSTPVTAAAGALLLGTLFSIFLINIPLSCRPGCLIHRTKLGMAFDTGVENTPRGVHRDTVAQLPNRTRAGAHK